MLSYACYICVDAGTGGHISTHVPAGCTRLFVEVALAERHPSVKEKVKSEYRLVVTSAAIVAVEKAPFNECSPNKC
jgi:hypothetical protein